MNPAERILTTFAGFLKGPAKLRLMGGAALILGYGRQRATEDVDILQRDDEVTGMIASADLGAALEATNQKLEAEGLYFSHIWGPEQQILTPNWELDCRPIDHDWGSPNLQVSVLGPLDLILSKLCRADQGDLDDIEFLIRTQGIDRARFEAGLASALVPVDFREGLPAHADRVREILGSVAEGAGLE